MKRQKGRQDDFHQAYIRNGYNGKTRQTRQSCGETCLCFFIQQRNGRSRPLRLTGSTCRVVRKTTRWYKKLFFCMFDIAIVNTYLIFRKTRAQANGMTLPHFKILLARQMLQSGTTIAYQKRDLPKSLPTPDRLQASNGHFLELIPPTGGKNVVYKRCTVCLNHDMRKKTKFQCDICQQLLCPAPYFKSYILHHCTFLIKYVHLQTLLCFFFDLFQLLKSTNKKKCNKIKIDSMTSDRNQTFQNLQIFVKKIP